MHGYLESDEDLRRLDRLMAAIEVWCAGRGWQRVGRNDRFTLTIGPPRDPAAELPDVDTVARELAAQAAQLADESADRGGWRWQVYLAKHAPDPLF